MAELSQRTKEAVTEAILEADLLKFGEFKLKSEIISPFYLNFRTAQSHPVAFRAIVGAYAEMLENSDSSTLIAGIPEAATPFAGALVDRLGRPSVQPRKIVKDHGTKSLVEGDFKEGDRVILIDDLITKGDSKIEAIKQVEKAGLVVEKFIVLVDREQGGLDVIREAGYSIEAGLSISSLIKILLDKEKISQEQHDTVIDFIRNN